MSNPDENIPEATCADDPPKNPPPPPVGDQPPPKEPILPHDIC